MGFLFSGSTFLKGLLAEKSKCYKNGSFFCFFCPQISIEFYFCTTKNFENSR